MDSMNEAERRALICHMVTAMREEGSWTGETQIQKSAMFLQKMLGVPLGYDFVLYLHGPFSFDLRRELTLMRVRHYLDVEQRAQYGASFKQGTRSLRITARASNYKEAIDFVAREVSPNDVRSLERISTAYFLQDTDPSLDREEIAIEINRLKPHISVDQAREAVDQINDLRQSVTNLESLTALDPAGRRS